jgi:bifunctional DNA-binding transcriptional regulator/antitoxin component of YhaV-PrlF toxin-antitoxin module
MNDDRFRLLAKKRLGLYGRINLPDVVRRVLALKIGDELHFYYDTKEDRLVITAPNRPSAPSTQ